MIQKSRNIPLSELYSNLQIEYLSYFVRSKIYCKDFAERYRSVCDAKREKIENISKVNNLPSIFNNEEEKEKFINRFLNPSGVPNFTYKDEAIKNKMEIWDNNYFFFKGTSVKITINGKVELGVVNNNSKGKKILVVVDEYNKEHTLHYNNVTRLFPQDFFKFN